MPGKFYEVRSGETIVQIAHQNGFRAWQPIWDHAENAALRRQRPNAYLLAAGDRLFIPDMAVKDHSCATNHQHVFRVRAMTQQLHQILLDARSRPLAGKRFELKVGGKTITGTTEGDGSLRAEVPLDATTAELTAWLPQGTSEVARTWQLQLGKLEPLDTPAGVSSHLQNLGYASDGSPDQLRSALQKFQRDHRLDPTGECDGPTRGRLHALHSYPQEGSS